MGRCSMSLAIRDTRTKPTTSCHHTPGGMVPTQTTDRSKQGDHMANGALLHCWWAHEMVRPPWNTVSQLLIQVEQTLAL